MTETTNPSPITTAPGNQDADRAKEIPPAKLGRLVSDPLFDQYPKGEDFTPAAGK